MKDNPIPVGTPSCFEGDITKTNPKAFGFFEVEVTAPNINIPILQTKSGLITITPIGTWSGVYFSEEINNAKKYGYKFNIIRGYTFDKGYIFSEYITNLYNIKQNHTKDSPMYSIAKLLLNSLYGRFGMNPQIVNHRIINSIDSNEFTKNKNGVNIIDFKNGKELISYFEESNYLTNVSIPVSASITAYARIHMFTLIKILERLDYKIYYMDTDSLYLNKPLDIKYVGKELGKMKLEHIFKEAIFLAPKVYGGITIEGKNIIKIKGSKNSLEYIKMKELLYKDKFTKIPTEKWYRNIGEGNITIKNELYTLTINEGKRKLIYDNNKLINTLPLQLNESRQN